MNVGDRWPEEPCMTGRGTRAAGASRGMLRPCMLLMAMLVWVMAQGEAPQTTNRQQTESHPTRLDGRDAKEEGKANAEGVWKGGGEDATRKVGGRAYTQEHPLVYEDVWDLWPYAFLNEHGQADGFNVELIRMVLGELGIPYTIKMGSAQQAFNDLRDGRSDLMMGLAVGFHDEYGLYSQNPVTLFTQSVVSPKGDPVVIRGLKDLGTHQVMVNDSSFCHHLMIDYGWGDNAIPCTDIKKALQDISTNDEGMIVWNTLSLKWLMHKYQIENLQITPVNMPHGEYKFMSNDPELLNRLDSVYMALDATDKLTRLRNKWFYPERQETGIPSWVWLLAGGGGLLALILGVYAVIYNVQGSRLAKRNERRNKRLALILETSQVRIWTYEVATSTFIWHNENGQPSYTYTAEEFAHRYHPGDFERLMQALRQLAEKKYEKGAAEDEITLNIKARDTEDGDAEEKDFLIALSVLHRDKRGNATVILGTKRDTTDLVRRQRLKTESIQRYWAIFNMPMLGILRFASDGTMVNINQKACEMFGCEREAVLASGVTYKEFLHLDGLDPAAAHGYSCTKTFGAMTCHMRLLTYEESEGGGQLGLMAVCRDITAIIAKKAESEQLTQQVTQATEELNRYFQRIDGLLRDGRIRMVSYSPSSHTLTIQSGTQQVQHTLTQTRCMTLVDESAQKKTMRILNEMDERADKELRFDLLTKIRPKGDYPLHLLFSFIPIYDARGQVTEYFGMCQDITTQKATEYKLAQEAQKVQEVENTKTSFINNMVEEIRKPMSTIVASADQLDPGHDVSTDGPLYQSILDNSNHLLYLINNILYLSRLEAHMEEVSKQPCDFVDTFATYCKAGDKKSADVRFVTESPYEQLVVNIDARKVGDIMERVIDNATAHTHQGFIRVRYDYIGRRLMISVEDTGDGIPPKTLATLNSQQASDLRTSSGLGLHICKELLAQMGGYLEINSEEGFGTTVWITIPCQATAIKRKKLV